MLYSHKRQTKKNKLQRNTKRRLIAFYSMIVATSLLFGSGVLCILVLQSQKPLLISPLAGMKAFATNVHEDELVKEVKQALKEKAIPYTNVESRDSFYIVSLENGAEVTLSAKKDIITQISSLQFILARLTMEGRQFRKLDLQFDKPIIVFKE